MRIKPLEKNGHKPLTSYNFQLNDFDLDGLLKTKFDADAKYILKVDLNNAEESRDDHIRFSVHPTKEKF